LPPEESYSSENNARRSGIINESLPVSRSRRHSKPIELSKTFTAGAEMIDPGIDFRNRNLMACQALQKL
jgi:hypothetical protein